MKKRKRTNTTGWPAGRLGYLLGKITNDQMDDDEEQEVELEFFFIRAHYES